MAEEVGGFYASLKLMTDDSSFRRGGDAVKGVASGLKGLIGLGLGIAGLTLSVKALIESLKAQAETVIDASYLDMSATSLARWGAAMRVAGQNSDGFTAALDALHKKMVLFRTRGTPLSDDFMLALAHLGINADAFVKMNTEQQAQAIFQGAEKQPKNMSDRTNEALTTILGDTARNFYIHNQALGISTAGALGAAPQMESGQNFKDALEFSHQFNTTVAWLKTIFDTFSADLGGDFTKTLKDLNEWLRSHQQDIKDFVKAVAAFSFAVLKFTGTAFIKTFEYGSTMKDFVTALFKGDNKGMAAAASRATDVVTSILPGLKKSLDIETAVGNFRDEMADRMRFKGAYAPGGALPIDIHIHDHTAGGIKVDSSHPLGSNGGLLYAANQR